MHGDATMAANPAVAAGELRSEDHIRFLDHIRGVAILCVFFFHCLDATFGFDDLKWQGWFRNFDVPAAFLALLPAALGQVGVPIFFVVSGFCIHLSYQRSKRHGYKEFFWRRFFRIYPVYFAALLLFAFVDPATRIVGQPHAAGQFFSHLFLIHNYFGYRYFLGINGVFWSIAVEVQLYAIYPLLLWLVSRTGWRGALWTTGIIEVTMSSLWAIWDVHRSESWPLVFRLPTSWWFSWSIGAAIADDWMNKRPIFLARWPVWFWPLVTVGIWFWKPLHVYEFTTGALSTAVVVAHLLTRPGVRVPVPRFISEQLRLAGVMSYSIYLLHLPLLRRVPHVLERVLPNVHFPDLALYGICVLTWPLILIPSWLFYRFGEVPSIEYGKAFVKKRRVGATSAAQIPPPVIAGEKLER
jgi:peptidoglycan/LPS O-acetylase OafA/YrhL